ncbi:MAG: DUF1566 domain-containing protein [Deltaproteobacteria bacterium]|nr:DUF1566 domain-containing protein [Deltaproteobacteria bacterium]
MLIFIFAYGCYFLIGIYRELSVSASLADEHGEKLISIKTKKEDKICEFEKGRQILRSNYAEISMSQILKLPFFQLTSERFGALGNCGYFGGEKGLYKHDYIREAFNGGRVVTDIATGLMWHQSGSEKFNNWDEAMDWVNKLNYAGFRDWRLPTVEEVISLLEPECDKKVKMFIHKYFDTKQIRIWTGDTEKKTEKVWYVHFKKSFKNPTGYVDSKETKDTKIIKHLFIRPVRSIETYVKYVYVCFHPEPTESYVKLTDKNDKSIKEIGTKRNKYKLLKGEDYHVAVSLEGYKEEGIHFRAKDNETYNISLELDWVNVNFNTEPSGANLEIIAKTDGHIKKEGTSGNKYKLQRGKKYNVTVSLNGYITENYTIQVSDNNRQSNKLPKYLTNTNSHSKLSGAILRIADKEDDLIRMDATSGYSYTLQRGDVYNVVISLKEYKKVENTIPVNGGKVVSLKLKPKVRSHYERLSMDKIIELPLFKVTGKRFLFSGNCGYCTIKHEYVSKDIREERVVIDNATGLMWHQSGSEESKNWEEAKDWVRDLSYAGFDDWRLPTVDEALSLLEHDKKGNKMYIDPFFDSKQYRIWTGDTNSESKKVKAWCVNFKTIISPNGFVHCKETDSITTFIRPVRSMK